jgi:hypothetical protein
VPDERTRGRQIPENDGHAQRHELKYLSRNIFLILWHVRQKNNSDSRLRDLSRDAIVWNWAIDKETRTGLTPVYFRPEPAHIHLRRAFLRNNTPPDLPILLDENVVNAQAQFHETPRDNAVKHDIENLFLLKLPLVGKEIQAGEIVQHERSWRVLLKAIGRRLVRDYQRITISGCPVQLPSDETRRRFAKKIRNARPHADPSFIVFSAIKNYLAIQFSSQPNTERDEFWRMYMENSSLRSACKTVCAMGSAETI